MIAERAALPSGSIAERPMTREQMVRDRLRRHFDSTDTELMVNALERDYDLRMRGEPCAYRASTYHITFAIDPSEELGAVLQGYADGMNLTEIVQELRRKGLLMSNGGLANSHSRDYQMLRSRMRRYAGKITRAELRGSWRLGCERLAAFEPLVPIAIHFGVVVPTMFIDKGEYLT